MTKYSLTFNGGQKFECDSDEAIMDAAEAAGIEMPFSYRAGSCNECLCYAPPGTTDNSDTSILDENHLSKGLMTPCVAKPTADIDIVKINGEILDETRQADEIETSAEATYWYFFGDGSARFLGPNTIAELQMSPRHLEAIQNIINGITDKSGNYQVDMTSEVFHVGRTGVHYQTVCSGGACTTTFTGFVKASGSTILDPDMYEEPIRIPGVEIVGGIPFPYVPHVWQETFADPGT